VASRPAPLGSGTLFAGGTVPFFLPGNGVPARLDPLAEDPPGTLYVAISEDRQTAWLTALSLEDMLRLPSGEPAVIEAFRGTHTPPGTDLAVPVYPRGGRAGR